MLDKRTLNNSLTYLIFPFAVVWFELLLHLKIRAEMEFSPIYIVFSVSAGLLLGLIPSLLRGKAEKIVRVTLLFLLWLVFAAESVGYYILQTFYPVSALGTAAENRLYDYIDVILITIRKNFLYLVMLLLPVLAGVLIPAKSSEITVYQGKKKTVVSERKYSTLFRVLTAVLIVLLVFVFHYTGILITRMNWGEGDMAPSRLYNLDEYFDIQVERLGLLTMLRLDVTHQLFPSTVAAPDISFIPSDDGLDGITDEPTEDVPEADPVDRSPQILDVDLTGLMESGDSDVQWIASYMNSVRPTKKNEYTGMFEGYNVIFLCLEAFSGAAIDPVLTPTLYKLSNECFVFNNFYTPLYYGSTNAGECQNLLGLYPKQGSPMSLEESGKLGTNCYFSLGPQLARKGYHNIGFHNGWDMYGRAATMANLEYYDWYYLGNGMQAEFWGSDYRWPQRDTFMIENTTDMYMYDSVPFNAYYMTISGHTPYSWGWIAQQYEAELSSYGWSESTKQYVATVMEVDRALEALLARLEEAGQLDRTLIVAVADHIPYTAVESVGELMGKDMGTSEDAIYCNERYLDTEVYRNTLIMWTGSMEEKVIVDKVCTQVDILPTLLNLLGVDYDSRMLPGSDMLSEAAGLVIFYSKCWRSDNGFYNSYTQEFTLKDGLSFSDAAIEKYVESMNSVVDCKRYLTPMILSTDFYDIVFG